jgi:putative transposase
VHDLKRANDVKAQCRETRSHYKRNDVQIRKALYGKYGMIQKNRVSQLLYNVSKKIIEHAKANRLAITMENIKGICKLYRAGNGQGNKYCARMNSWSFYELQRQIQYKAGWEGIYRFTMSTQEERH